MILCHSLSSKIIISSFIGQFSHGISIFIGADNSLLQRLYIFQFKVTYLIIPEISHGKKVYPNKQ